MALFEGKDEVTPAAGASLCPPLRPVLGENVGVLDWGAHQSESGARELLATLGPFADDLHRDLHLQPQAACVAIRSGAN